MPNPMIVNPVLRGFEPDPSILRVGDDYYVATSTFEWFPGVRLHHSRDLVHWRITGHALTSREQLDLRGIENSGGIWAPALSHHDGLFWLVYTVVRHKPGNHLDLDNFLVTAPSIEGPWSDPGFLNSSGFDPSLFHDEDGRRWLVNVAWDFRPGHPDFAGIVLQEYDHERRTLTGPVRTLLTRGAFGDELIEGPNLYRHGDWYYLVLAEGGTGWDHGICLARARELTGPYELDSLPAILTSRDTPKAPLQKAGHGALVETPDGAWYLAHLASRPVAISAPPPDSGAMPDRDREGQFCVLGRETCLQLVNWTNDGWLRLADGGTQPQVEVPAPLNALELPAFDGEPAFVDESDHDDFDAPVLSPQWSTLRVPADPSWLDLTTRPGWLRLRGRESTQSLFEQSLVARRLTEPVAVATTVLDFHPTHFTQLAGLLFWYDTTTHYYLRVTDLDGRRIIGLTAQDDGRYEEHPTSQIDSTDWPLIHLRLSIDHENASFFASPDGSTWQQIGPAVDATRISDDYGSTPRFTGAFVGLCAQDLARRSAHADFDSFELRTHQPTTGDDRS